MRALPLSRFPQTDSGNYTGDNEADVMVAKLHAHAPEIIQDSDGQWYITACGCRSYNTPVEEGAAIAKLEWKAQS